jgi:hypothetical protein
MFRWKTSLGADDAVKHSKHNQKTHGNRAGARVKFGKAKTAGGEGASATDADDEFTAAHKQKARESSQKALEGFSEKIESAERAVKTWEGFEQSYAEKVKNGEQKIAELAARGMSSANIERMLEADREMLKNSRENVAILRFDRDDMLRRQAELKAALDNPNTERMPGFPSAQMAKEAVALRESAVARNKEIADELAGVEKKISDTTRGLADSSSEIDELRDELRRTPPFDGRYEARSKAYEDARAKYEASLNELQAMQGERDRLNNERNAANETLLNQIAKNVRSGSPGEFTQSVDVRRGTEPEIADSVNQTLSRMQAVLDSRLGTGRVSVAANDDTFLDGEYNPQTREIGISRGLLGNRSRMDAVFAHELAHSFEKNDAVATQALAFRDRRSPNESIAQLNGKPPGINGYNDAYEDSYAGRIYNGTRSTEIISHGIQRMMTDAVNFAQNDPDYFDFVYSIMRGDF